MVYYWNDNTRTGWFSTLHPRNRERQKVRGLFLYLPNHTHHGNWKTEGDMKTSPENIKKMEEAVTNLVDAYRDLIDVEDCEIQSDSYITDKTMTIKLRVKVEK